MGEYNWYSNVIFSSEAGRQAYRDDEFDWYEEVCEECGYEPEQYED